MSQGGVGVKPGVNGVRTVAGNEIFEETLDPADWGAFRELAHRMLDRMVDYQMSAGEEPGWRPVPDEIDRRFHGVLPREGIGAEATYDDFLEMVLPYPTGLHHPRWWGWAGGTGSPMGMMADLLASGMNAVPANFNDSAARVEAQVLETMKAALGFPAEASGIITSGGSVANLVGLTVGRDAAAGHDVREEGVRASAGDLVLYASSEVHSSVFKAARMMGLGSKGVRVVGVDADFKILVPELEEAIARDRAAGLEPFAIVGTAGTINTGAVDDLTALADIAEREGLWFHIDGAFGAIVALSERHREQVAGLERADSLAFDFHKWMYVNYEAGCVLVRDADAHRRSFSGGGDYLKPLPRGTGSLADIAGGRGPQLSRGFKALKVWMTLKQHGLEKFGRLVDQNLEQTRYLAGLIDDSETLTRVAPVELNVVAFRAAPDGLGPDAADALNRELLMRIQERGVAIPSSTLIDGRFALRACICNHRSRRSDFDDFVGRAEEIAREITEKMDRVGAG